MAAVARNALPGSGIPPVPQNPAFRMTAFIILATILYVSKDKVKDAFTPANTFMSTESAFASLLATFHFLRRRVVRSPRITQPQGGRYHCATQPDADMGLRIGVNRLIPRWTRGSTLKYTICAESFPQHNMAVYATGKLAEATSMWKDKGVKFQQVYRTCKATFQVVYRVADSEPNVFAKAFFPNTYSPAARTLIVYELALKEANRDYLPKIFAHKVGHILGLRHEFLEPGSVLWGEENDSSIMNYFDHPSKLRVQEQDLNEVESFYESTKKEHKNLMICEFEPLVSIYN